MPPAVVAVHLLSSVYLFEPNAIIISARETRDDGSTEEVSLHLDPTEVAAYFATPMSPYGFRATFVAAFAGAVQARYGAAAVSA